MSAKTLQAMVASDNPQVQNFLCDAMKRETGAIIVGQALNAGEALILARKLRPDVAVIDSYLPYTIGWGFNPQSRISGLDTAQIISEEMPGVKVILVSNLDGEMLLNRSSELLSAESYSVQSSRNNVASGLSELCHEASNPMGLVFANVDLKPQVAGNQLAMTNDKLMSVGISCMLIGAILFLTLWLMVVGVALALAGGMIVMLGLARKLTARLRHKPGRPG